MRVGCWRLLGVALLACLCAGPVSAAEVVLASGGVLEVEDYRVEGNAIWLYLPGGGTVAVLAGHVVEIRGAAKAVPAPQPASQIASAPSQAVPALAAPEPVIEVADLDGIIQVAARRHGVDPLLVRAVIQVESAWNPRAVSPKGAQGLMQLMPATARAHGVKDPFDPAQNVEAGTEELAALLRAHDGELSMALAAYNAGGRAVNRHEGIPPYRETLGYVDKVLALYFDWAGEAESAPETQDGGPATAPRTVVAPPPSSSPAEARMAEVKAGAASR